MPRVLGRPVGVEPLTGLEHGLGRRLARRAGSAACAASTERDFPPSSVPSTAAALSPLVSLSSTARPFSRRAVILPPGAQRLSRSSLFLKMRIGVVGAIIAALAAVLLGHGGHQARRDRAVLGHLHPLLGLERRVVPGRFVVGGEDRAARGRGLGPGSLLATGAASAMAAMEAEKKPDSHERCSGVKGADSGITTVRCWAALMTGPSASPSARLFNASTSCRLAKAVEALGRRGAVIEIGLEQALDPRRRLLGLRVGVDHLGDGGFRAEAAADVDVVARYRIVVADRHLDADEPDVADVMLGAGVGAPRQVDVDRLVHRHARLDDGPRSRCRCASCRHWRTCSRRSPCRPRGRPGSSRPACRDRWPRWPT